MNKGEIKKALDRISEMNDKEIDINHDFIRKVAIDAYSLIGNLEGALYKKKMKKNL